MIVAIHGVELGTFVHTPNPMRFLNKLCDRPEIASFV